MRGALFTTGVQIAGLFLRIGSMMILARLLLKEDFGLVNMVTAFTGFLGLFRDAGLSVAAVQQTEISESQVNALFWINIMVGVLLALLAAVAAPLLAAFYGEPRVLWILVSLAPMFLLNGAVAQHRAKLQRSLRFREVGIIDFTSQVLSVVVGIGLALAGFGYWALVMMNLSQPLGNCVGSWLFARWIPGRPRMVGGVRSMLLFGGTVTLRNVVHYLACNVDKILLGKYWGAEALGVYGRAYTLINLPTENLNSTIELVSFSALSRVKDDPPRLRSFFLNSYNFFLSIVMPVTIGCALFADDIVHVFLGPNWEEAVPIFRLLAPTILAFALINPHTWLVLARGHAVRNLKIALLIAPAVVVGCAVSLSGGPKGIATGLSVSMLLLTIPIIAWANSGTLITGRDVMETALKPFLSTLIGAVAVFAASGMAARVEIAFLRLVAESTILFGVYLVVLLFVMKQKPVYMALLKDIGIRLPKWMA